MHLRSKQQTTGQNDVRTVPERAVAVSRGPKKNPVPRNRKTNHTGLIEEKALLVLKKSRMRRKFYDEMTVRYDEMVRRHSEVERQLRRIEVENVYLRCISDLVMNAKTLYPYSLTRKVKDNEKHSPAIDINNDKDCKSYAESSCNSPGESVQKCLDDVINDKALNEVPSTYEESSTDDSQDTHVVPHKIRIKRRFHTAFNVQFD